MTPPRKYALGPRPILYLTLRIFTGLPRRTLDQDVAWMHTLYPSPPIVSGAAYIPADRPILVCANHYQRPGLWIGWSGGIIADAINTVQPHPVPFRVIVTDSQRMRLFGQERLLPLSRWFLGRIARAWEMIPIPADRADTAGQATALRASLKTLDKGQSILFFPEGERGSASGLIEALPGTGTFIALASRRATILPCSLWEEDDTLHAAFGPPLTLVSRDDTAVRDQVMRAIATMLPATLHGTYPV